MDTIRLRTLAPKSILGFGKYADLSVEQLINFREGRYLRWVYYNSSMISFRDDILERIFIREEHKIEKPGVNPERFKEINDAYRKRMTIEDRCVLYQKKKKFKRRRSLTGRWLWILCSNKESFKEHKPRTCKILTMEQRGVRNIILKVNHQKSLERTVDTFDKMVDNFEKVSHLLMNNKSGIL